MKRENGLQNPSAHRPVVAILSKLTLMAALALSASACGEVGMSSAATFAVGPVGDTSARWTSNKAIAVGSKFEVSADRFGRGTLHVKVSEEGVLLPLGDGVFEAMKPGAVQFQAVDDAGAVVDVLPLRVASPDRLVVTVASAPLQPPQPAERALWLMRDSELELRGELSAGGQALHHADLVSVSRKSGDLHIAASRQGKAKIVGQTVGAAAINFAVRDRPELSATHGIVTTTEHAIVDVTYHTSELGEPTDTDTKRTMLVWLKAWQADGKQIHGARAKWTSMVSHLEVLAPKPEQPLAVAIVRGNLGAKGGLRSQIGDRDDVFVLHLPDRLAQ